MLRPLTLLAPAEVRQALEHVLLLLTVSPVRHLLLRCGLATPLSASFVSLTVPPNL
jgi:hypothetical protein